MCFGDIDGDYCGCGNGVMKEFHCLADQGMRWKMCVFGKGLFGRTLVLEWTGNGKEGGGSGKMDCGHLCGRSGAMSVGDIRTYTTCVEEHAY